MIQDVSRIIFDRLTEAITDSATPGLAGVVVWNEDRPREGEPTYVTFTHDTTQGVSGSAPIHGVTVEVSGYSQSQTGAALLAEACKEALEGFTRVLNDVRVAGLQFSGSVRDFNAETGIWVHTVRFAGLVID